MPDDTPEMVEKKVRHVSPEAAQAAEMAALLAEYGVEPHEREPDRVRLAILQLSDAGPDVVLHNVLAAKRDYRDVLAWAEYPAQMRLGPEASPAEQKRAAADDAARYRRWLEG